MEKIMCAYCVKVILAIATSYTCTLALSVEKEQFEKEEKKQLRAERLEKREANKSKEFEVIIE